MPITLLLASMRNEGHELPASAMEHHAIRTVCGTILEWPELASRDVVRNWKLHQIIRIQFASREKVADSCEARAGKEHWSRIPLAIRSGYRFPVVEEHGPVVQSSLDLVSSVRMCRRIV